VPDGIDPLGLDYTVGDIWWNHYINGDGRELDIRDYPALYNSVLLSSETESATTTLSNKVTTNAIAFAASQPCGTSGSVPFGKAFISPDTKDFYSASPNYGAPTSGASAETLLRGYVDLNNSTIRKPHTTTPYALGHSKITAFGGCQYSTSCCKDGKTVKSAEVICNITFELRDRFADPWDPLNITKGEWDPGGKPYNISAKWTVSYYDKHDNTCPQDCSE
jgi:hypothetical protein